jgi:hypothetical protein
MRSVPLVVAILFSEVAAFGSGIREFSVPTLERLGNQLCRQEAITERAAEIVLKTQPVARSLKLHGWITELRKDGDINYMIADTPSGPSLAYSVTFRDSSKPEVQDRRGQPLPPEIAIRYRANQTAAKVLEKRLHNIGYNFEVLNDPDGSGFLVYAVGVTSKPSDVVVAGHFRVTISSDGEKAERVDPLSEGVMITNKNENHSPAGYHDVAMYFNQVVSNKPVETFINASKLLQKDIFVRTPDGKVWCVHNGRMTIDTSKADNKTAGGAAKKALKQ